MDSELILSQDTLAEQFSDIYNAGRLTNADLQRWELARGNSALSEEEASLVTRLFHAVKRGWLKVIDG